MKKMNKIIFITKILISTKLSNPIRETRILKLVFITIPCLKFWAQSNLRSNKYCVRFQINYHGKRPRTSESSKELIQCRLNNF